MGGGKMWYYNNFNIEMDKEVSTKLCNHCIGPFTKVLHDYRTGEEYEYTYYICPRVVNAYDADCSSTSTCLDCILEAAHNLDTESTKEEIY